MSFKYFYRDNDGTITEFTSRVQVGGLRADNVDEPGTDGMVMNAEEGTSGGSSLKVDDPGGVFVINGHRLIYIEETLCAGDDFDGRVWAGYSTVREITREAEPMGGVGRTVTITVDDINSILDRRIQFGAENKRPAETDVARIAWLLTTNEASLIDDDEFFSSDDPVDMDAADYRNQAFRSILDDCAQQSGKNWYLWMSANGYSLWYAPKASTDFASDLKISNDPAEIDSVDTFAPATTTRFKRDPTRVYSGANVAYDGGNAYVQDDIIAADYARRDVTAPAVNVKTKAAATRRGLRYLRDNDTEEDTISTAIVVPRADANRLVAGHRVEVLFTHLAPEGYGDWTWMRVLNRTIREVSLARVELAVELVGDAPAPPAPPVYGILRRSQINGTQTAVYWDFPGDTPKAGYPTQPTTGAISVLTDGSPPSADYPHTGFEVTGTGTIDVTFFATVAGVGGSISCTFAITKNGVVVESSVATHPGGFVGMDGTVTATALAVAPGDIIAATIVPSYFPFFWVSPRGTGQAQERLEITDGTLV